MSETACTLKTVVVDVEVVVNHAVAVTEMDKILLLVLLVLLVVFRFLIVRR